jgi:hypothetical protein
MKTLPTFLILSCLATALSHGQGASKPVMRDAATHEQLAGQLRQVEAADPMKKLTPSEGKDPSKENQPGDLISRSDILCYRGMATLVPKGAILVNPPLVNDRLGMKAGAKIVPWMEFYAANRGWITTQEITLAQAEGKAPLPEAVTEQLKRSTNLVVATLQGGPISKLAPKAEQNPQQPATGAIR